MALCIHSHPLHIPMTAEDKGSFTVTGPMSPSSSSSSPSLLSSTPSPVYESSEDELLEVPPVTAAAGGSGKKKRRFKHLSICETPRDMAWERRRRQIIGQGGRRGSFHDCGDLTDEDLNELKGSIELGFGFNEEDGQRLCNTLPALDLYFAVNRQLSTSPATTPRPSMGGRSSSFGSPISSSAVVDSSDSWKICSPGDDPNHVKTKLRHWAQAVACSVMQSY